LRRVSFDDNPRVLAQAFGGGFAECIREPRDQLAACLLVHPEVEKLHLDQRHWFSSWSVRFKRLDRSFPTDARAKPARPEGRHRKRCLRSKSFTSISGMGLARWLAGDPPVLGRNALNDDVDVLLRRTARVG